MEKERNENISTGSLKDVPFSQESIDTLKKAISGIESKDLDLSTLPAGTRRYLANILRLKESFDIDSIIANGMEYQNLIEGNKNEFKELRRLFLENRAAIFRNKSASLHDKDVDELFSASIFKKRFIDYIDCQLTVPIKSEKEREYHRIIMGYFVVHALGMDSESNKKTRFKNTFNDALHTYYASYCHIFITNDHGLMEKGTFVYKIFGSITKMFEPRDFIINIENQPKNG
ncbi:MAG: hypothetical protein PHI34_14855 [Acidobacteriota bacterium]|nr:hypothetical protein [Acidobacteriota bacterium]